ncbi:hypothetical protein [Microbacterium aureliae]
MNRDSSIDPDDDVIVEPLASETDGVDVSEIPAVDTHAGDLDQPDTQGEDPLEAELGEDGQGDLAPEDDPAASSSLEDAGPTDLRTEI